MIEQELKRMADAQERTADALEMICAYVKGGIAQASIPVAAAGTVEKPKRTRKAAEAEVVAPVAPPMAAPVVAPAGIGAFVPPPVAAPVAAPVATATTQAWPSNPTELMLMAQKIAQKTAPNTLAFVEYVNGIINPMGVKVLVNVPQDQVMAVAVKLDEYAKKAGINV